jgi:hypothetical protein
MNNEILSLDDLFRVAKKQIIASREAAKAPRRSEDKTPASVTPSAIYTNPANWELGRRLALIHEETGTLLGVFTELLHTSVVDCRRLIRDESVSPVQGVEYVHGEGWLEQSPPLPQQLLTRTVEKVLPLTLTFAFACLGGCSVLAVVTASSVVSVRLAQAAVFTGGCSEALCLPANTDVWPLLAVETKRTLWKMIGEAE